MRRPAEPRPAALPSGSASWRCRLACRWPSPPSPCNRWPPRPASAAAAGSLTGEASKYRPAAARFLPPLLPRACTQQQSRQCRLLLRRRSTAAVLCLPAASWCVGEHVLLMVQLRGSVPSSSHAPSACCSPQPCLPLPPARKAGALVLLARAAPALLTLPPAPAANVFSSRTMRRV